MTADHVAQQALAPADNTHSLSRATGAIRENPALFAAFSVYRMIEMSLLTGLVFFNIPFAGASALNHVENIPATLPLLLACTVVFGVLALRAKTLRPTGKPLVSWVSSAMLAIGLILVRGGGHIFLALLTGSILAAVGFSVIHIELGRIAGYLGTSKTLIYTAASSLVGTALFAVVYLAPAPVDTLCTVLSLICMTAALERAKARIGRRRLFVERCVDLHIPYRFIATSFVQGVTIGVACTLFHVAADAGAFLQTFATIGACVAAFVTVIVMRVNYDRLIYRIGFLAMGAGMPLYAVAGSPGGRTVALLIQICAFTYLDLVLWSFGSYLIKHLNQPAIWATCCPTASLMGGRFLGTVIGFVLLSGNVATGRWRSAPARWRRSSHFPS